MGRFERETESPEVRSILQVHSPQRSVRGEADYAESSGQDVGGAIDVGSDHQGTKGDSRHVRLYGLHG